MTFFTKPQLLLTAENDNMNWQLFYAGIVLLATILCMIRTFHTFPTHLSRKDKSFDDYNKWFISNQKNIHSKLLLSPNCITWGSVDDQKRMKRNRGKLTKTIRRFYSAATRLAKNPVEIKIR